MKATEKEEISKLPMKYRPLGAWAYFGYSILFAIPIVGFICLIIFSFNSGNINRRSYARSFFCVYLIIAIFFIFAILVFGINFSIILDAIRGAVS